LKIRFHKRKVSLFVVRTVKCKCGIKFIQEILHNAQFVHVDASSARRQELGGALVDVISIKRPIIVFETEGKFVDYNLKQY